MISIAKPSSKEIEKDPLVCGPIMPIKPDTSPRARSSFLRAALPGFKSTCAIIDKTFCNDDKNGFTNSTFILILHPNIDAYSYYDSSRQLLHIPWASTV